MHVALDVHYADSSAHAAGIVFPTWESEQPSRHYLIKVEETAPYQPGSFYLRELPCLQRVLEVISEPITTIVIDGFVTLGNDQRPGLGAHLWHSLDEKIPVIGVAKTVFEGTPEEAQLLRGQSQKPLFVTCLGMPLHQAKQCILRMHGPHRIPALLKEVDRLSRST